MRAAAFLLCALACSGCLASRYRVPLAPEAEVLRARTQDGWEIALIHHRPQGPPTGLPVLLLHGISANGRNMDLDEGHSLARFLAAHGREAFAMSLRGNGDSDRADPDRGRSADYSMDTYATQDVPAAIEAIRARTGAAQVDFVGHSMGGLIGYIYLARGGDGFHALTTLGSPARFSWGRGLEQTLRSVGGVLGQHLTNVDAPFWADLTMPLHGEVRTALDDLLYNPANVPAPLWKRFVATGVGSISGGVLRQFTSWLERDAMVSADGEVDYLDALRRVRVPALVVAGKLDRIAPAANVKAAYEALGGPKRFFLAAEENGFAHDYGHMDLVIGDRAGVELWPRVLSFFESCRLEGCPP